MDKQNEGKEQLTMYAFHGISTAEISKCPECGNGAEQWELRNYNEMFRDGDIYCKCGQYIRMYDAG